MSSRDKAKSNPKQNKMKTAQRNLDAFHLEGAIKGFRSVGLANPKEPGDALSNASLCLSKLERYPESTVLAYASAAVCPAGKGYVRCSLALSQVGEPKAAAESLRRAQEQANLDKSDSTVKQLVEQLQEHQVSSRRICELEGAIARLKLRLATDKQFVNQATTEQALTKDGWRQTGKALFSDGKYEEALLVYFGAVLRLIDGEGVYQLAVALSRQGGKKQLSEAFGLLLVSYIFHQSEVDALVLSTSILMGLGELGAAGVVARQLHSSADLSPDQAALAECAFILSSFTMSTNHKEYCVTGFHNVSSADVEKAQHGGQQSLDLEQMRRTNQRSAMMSPELVDNSVYKIGKELREGGPLPIGCDRARILQTADLFHENQRCTMREMYFFGGLERLGQRTGRGSPGVMDNQELLRNLGQDIIKRLADPRPSAREWWLRGGPVGEIRKEESLKDPRGYSPEVVHFFSNAATLPTALWYGRVHVAVGFVDLGTLLHCTLNGDASQGAIRWVGYERSPYAVAKGLLLKELLVDRSVAAETVVEVWYSAGLTAESSAALRLAAARALRGPSLNATVKDILLLWASKEAPLAAAREAWWKGHEHDMFCSGSNLVIPGERLRMLHYNASGDFVRPGGHVTTGNPTFCIFLPGTSLILDSAAHVLGTIPRDQLFTERGRDGNDGDFLQCGYQLILQSVQGLQMAVQAGTMTIECRVGSIETAEMALANDRTPQQASDVVYSVKALEPATVTWSNIPDYMPLANFHLLARACSVKGTAHTCYSMNWFTKVRGAFVLDMWNEPAAARHDVLVSATKCIARYYASFGLAGVWKDPPATNAYNVADVELKLQVEDHWVKHFLDSSERSGSRAKGRVVWHTSHCELDKSTSVVYLKFQYDT